MGYPRALIICLGQKMRRTKHVFVDPLWRWTIEFISTPSFVDLSLILDFSLVLAFNHLVLTTYYLAALPTSLLFVIVLDGAVLTIVVAEQLCVKREMLERPSVVPVRPDDLQAGRMEMSQLLPWIDYDLH